MHSIKKGISVLFAKSNPTPVIRQVVSCSFLSDALCLLNGKKITRQTSPRQSNLSSLVGVHFYLYFKKLQNASTACAAARYDYLCVAPIERQARPMALQRNVAASRCATDVHLTSGRQST